MTLPPVTTNPRRLVVPALAAVAAVGTVHALTSAPSAEAAPVLADRTMHLLRRATFGPSQTSYTEFRKMGTTVSARISAWLKQQLAPSTIADTAMDSYAKRFPRLAWRPWQVRDNIGYGWEVMNDYLRLHSARHVWSKRQLYETVCDFWNDHLVIPAPNGEVQASLHLWHRDVIRKYALGKYADLLKAAARHPAMLATLDNADSSKRSPNENYGRELLELHTVGHGNFSETDVKNSALALTGLSIDRESLEYEYKPHYRYVGAVKVLGWSHANSSFDGGQAVALSYLDYLARHPKTAERIARKLCLRYVSDAPSNTLVASLAKVYRDNDTAMVPVLRALFASSEFWASAGQKLRRPYEDLVATMRILGHGPDPTGTDSMGELRWMASRMANAPGGWSAPNGYPDVAAAWTSPSATLIRWNSHVGMAAGWSYRATKQPVLTSFVPSPLPATHGALMDKLADRLLLPPLTSTQRDALCAFVDKRATDPLRSTDAAVNWRLAYLLALLLDSPNFALR